MWHPTIVQSLLVTIAILDRKRWGVRGGVIIEIAAGKHTSYSFVEQSVFLFNAAISLAAEENRVTVSHIRSVTLDC